MCAQLPRVTVFLANQGNQVSTQEHFYEFWEKRLKILLKRKPETPNVSLVLKPMIPTHH